MKFPPLTLLFWGFLLLLVAACSSLNATQSLELATPVVQPKLLATLYLSPTPNNQEREATRLAVRSEPPTPLPTRTPAPTAYIGVFVGDAGGVDSGISFNDPANFDNAQAGSLPTLGAAGCVYPVDPIFGTAWTTNAPALADLGCAGEPSTPYIGTQQIFEHGVMYWIPSGEIWSVAPSGGIDGRFWYVLEAPPDQGWTVPAPEGLRMPEQGFGSVWKAVDGVRQTLGFARTDEQSASLAIQRFDGGALIRDETAGQTFLLVGRENGSAYGPY
ncbi:MAG: hypothetical protein ABI835_08470 [Chloroflexota bacterium]